MKPLPFSIAFTAIFTVSALLAENKPAAAPAAPGAVKPANPPVKLPAQAPDVAAPKVGPDGKPHAGFVGAHERFVTIAKEGKTDLLFLGDSITAGWGSQKAIWDKAFGAYKPANFGIGGDRTQHVLWRIQNGELDGIKPKAAVVMIGTNNSGSDPAEGIAKGVTKIVNTIREKSPSTKILLLAVFPRGDKANPAKAQQVQEQRDKLKKVNAIIAKLDDRKHVFFLDIGSKFLQPGDVLPKEVMPDFLHLSPKGYQIWADAITPKLAELMQ